MSLCPLLGRAAVLAVVLAAPQRLRPTNSLMPTRAAAVAAEVVTVAAAEIQRTTVWPLKLEAGVAAEVEAESPPTSSLGR